MQNTYTTKNLESQLIKINIAAAALIVLAIVKLMFKDFSEMGDEIRITDLIDVIFLPLAGILLFAFNYARLRKLRGSYIIFTDTGLAFKSHGIEKSFESFDDIAAIEVKLKLIEIYDSEYKAFIVHLDDYPDYAEKKTIKMEFNMLNDRLKILKRGE